MTTSPQRVCFLVASVLLLGAAWLLAQYPPITKVSSITEVSVTRVFLVAGALPWFLQWAGICCVVVVCLPGNRRSKQFAIFSSFILGAVWWSGITLMFRDMDGMDLALDVVMRGLRTQSGASSVVDGVVFDTIGPTLDLFRLSGPLTLNGRTFFFTFVSTSVLISYLLLVGSWCRIGSPARSMADYFKFVATILPCYLPGIARVAIRLAKSG